MTSDIAGIELFAGCGGISTGFLDAGLRIVAGYEIDRRAVDAYTYNHSYRGCVGHREDLSATSGSELLKRAGLDCVDFIAAGPPCQPFSIVGKRKGSEDVRANLIDHFARLVGELMPSAFLFENVPNLESIDDGKVWSRLIDTLGSFGYMIRHEVVSAAEFGVAQNRRRLMMMGFREGAGGISFPTKTHGANGKPLVTAGEALGDLPDAGEFGECGVYNHELTVHSSDMLTRFASLKPGQRERGSFHDRLHSNRPSFTLRAGSGNFSPLRPVHYKYDRVVTVRESARLQSFSDSFIWPDSIPRLQQYRQVGNAVPPLLAAAFARSLASQMGWILDVTRTHGDPESRPPAMTMTDNERRAIRYSRMRGASLGKSFVRAV